MSGTIISFTDADLLRGKVYTPGWYRVLIEEIGAKIAKNGESTNYPVSGKIIRNSDDGSEEFANHPLDWNFNSKAMGFAKGFFVAMGEGELETGKRYDLSAFAGKVIDVFVENGEYDGRIVNRVNHKYRTASAE